MPNKTYCSESRKAYYKISVDKSIRNAARRLAKHLKRHPNDKQSAQHVIPNYKKKGAQ